MNVKLFITPFLCATLILSQSCNTGQPKYISPQINRAVKNKSYFYNCYGKEEKFYIENQG
jgi:hypothetical protein